MASRGKRSRDQNGFDSNGQDQKRMVVHPDDCQRISYRYPQNSWLFDRGESELRSQGEIQIEIEPEIATECATVEFSPQWLIYTTRRDGESLLSIAAKFGMSAEEILGDNDQLYYRTGAGRTAKWASASQMEFQQGTQIWLDCNKSEYVEGAAQSYKMMRETMKHLSFIRTSELH